MATAAATPRRARLKDSSRQKSAAQPTTRQTRSRSRELGKSSVSVVPPTQYATKGLSDVESEDDNASEASPVRRIREKGKARNNELSPVLESPSANDSSFGTDLARQISRRSERSIPDSPIDHGNITGTTFLATDSEHESRELDPSIMVEALPDLSSSSDTTLRTLAPSKISFDNLCRALKTSGFRKKLDRIRATYEAQKDCFGTKHFIPVDHAADALPSLPRLQWRSDEIFQKANLAQLALDLVPFLENPASERQFSELENLFPSFFVSSFALQDDTPLGPGQSRQLDATFQFGLEIRTQYTIMRLKRTERTSSTSHPREMIEDTFTIPSLSEDEPYEIRGWDFDGLQEEGDLPRHLVDTAHERVDAILACFSDSTPQPSEYAELDKLFPWSNFVTDAAKWIRVRTDEIDEQIKNQVSIKDAMEILQAEIDRRSSLDQPAINAILQSAQHSPVRKEVTIVEPPTVSKSPAQKSSPAKTASPNKTKLSKDASAVRHLMLLQRSAALQSRQNDRPAEHTEEEQEPPSPTPSEIFQATQSNRATAPSSQRIHISRRPQAFIDRQTATRRVSPISLSERSPDRSQGNEHPKKRPAPSYSSDDGWDFDTDYRAIDVTKNRTSLQHRKRRRVESADRDSPERLQSTTPSRPQPRQSALPWLTQRSPRREGSRHVSASVELNTGDTRQPSRRPSTLPVATPESSQQVRKSKGRTGWSDDETQALIEWIGKLGTSWAYIKAQDQNTDNRLRRRDQGNLKDRASHLALKYRRERLPLPPNFELIKLKSVDKDKLKALGIDIDTYTPAE
ncbi:hypothetical protein FQN55_000669 [Onygenales sp. PD_40]|nr:hypothetical protein FQN55_000669 [Onygenales sp. PD_40]KAK2781808.1 hypothetical protein FQN53_000336 [Emmonsiellopsis sp. PD_33]